MKPTISVAMIVKNEFDNIVPFFASIKGMADELVVVDTGSTDGTFTLIRDLIEARDIPCPIFFMQKTFTPFHFGKAKNWAIRECTKDYVFVLDADQRLGLSFKEKIKPFLELQNPWYVRMLQRDDVVPHFVDPQIRMWRNHSGIEYREDEDSRTDEVFKFMGVAKDFDEPLHHLQGGRHKERRYRNWRAVIALDVLKAEKRGSTLREIVRVPLAFYYIFKKIYLSREAWKDGYQGLRYACTRAFYKAYVQLHVAFK